MDPLSIISLFINLATFNTNHAINTIHNQQQYHSISQVKQDIFNGSFKNNNIQQQYHSVYQVKQEIFNGSFKNSNLYNVKNISNLNISLNN